MLIAVVTLTEANGADGADLDDLLALDFLLAHPAHLLAFIQLNGERGSWPVGTRPSAKEVESSEEAFLLWKRSLAHEAAAPLLGRLIARRLIVWSGGLALAPTNLGRQCAEELIRAFRSTERQRVEHAAREFAAVGNLTHDRLRQSLTGGLPVGD